MDRDVLSQSEIDSLIGALSTGDLRKPAEKKELFAPDEATLYDFRRPNKFSKEHIRAMKAVHESFARVLANFLRAYLRIPIEVKLESISQVTYEEFIFSLPPSTLMTIFRLSEEIGRAILETGLQFIFPIVDVLLGGVGKPLQKSRELTEIEIGIMKKVNEKILNNLRYAWEDILPISPVIETLDANPHFNRLIVSNEIVVFLTFSVEIGDSQTFINLCFPFMTLEPILSDFSTQRWISSSSKSGADVKRTQKKLTNRIVESEVEMTAILGKTNITIEDFLNFEAGDVIQLDREIDDPVDIYLADKVIFSANLGTINNKMAGIITEVKGYEGAKG